MYSNLYVVKCPKFDHLITPLVWSSVQMGGGRLDQKISVCFIHRNWLRYRFVSPAFCRAAMASETMAQQETLPQSGK